MYCIDQLQNLLYCLDVLIHCIIQARERIAELNAQIETLKKQIETEKQVTSESQAGLLALKRKLEESLREQEELNEKLNAAEQSAAAVASLSKAEGASRINDFMSHRITSC